MSNTAIIINAIVFVALIGSLIKARDKTKQSLIIAGKLLDNDKS